MYKDKHKVCIWIPYLYKKWSTDLSNDINSRSIFCESTGAELLQNESFSFFSLTHSSNVVCPLFTFVCTHSLDLANVFACLPQMFYKHNKVSQLTWCYATTFYPFRYRVFANISLFDRDCKNSGGKIFTIWRPNNKAFWHLIIFLWIFF